MNKIGHVLEDQIREPGDGRVTGTIAESQEAPNSGKESRFRLKFEKESHDIDADTFGYVLLSFNEVIQEINKQRETGHSIRVKVTTLESGSYIVGIEIIQDFAHSLLAYIANEPVKTTTALISTLTGLLKLRKFLSKEKPKEIAERDGQFVLTNSTGGQMTINAPVYQTYNNYIIQENLDKAFYRMSEDDTLTGFQLQDEQKHPLFSVSKPEMGQMIESSPLPVVKSDGEVDVQEQIIQRPDITVYVVRPSFDPKLDWTVIYQSRRVSMKINSEAYDEFAQNLKDGFLPGDSLDIDLQVKQRKDPVAGVFIDMDRTYRILRVKRHHKKQRQASLLENL